MGGVCCKDGVESDREHSEQQQASVQHAQAPAPALPSAAVGDAEQGKIPTDSKKVEEGPPVDDVTEDDNIKPIVKREKSSVSKSAGVASASLGPIDEAQVVIDDSTGASALTHVGSFGPPAKSLGHDGTTVSTASRPSVPPLSAGSGASSPFEVAQVAPAPHVPAAMPVSISKLEAKNESSGMSTPFVNAPLLDLQQPRTTEVNSSSGPRNLSTTDLATDMRVKVETTRRSTHPTMSQPVGDGSSNVSYSHSAASSQQPGSSVVPAGSSAGHGGLSPMIGSSAAYADMIPGESSAAAAQATAAKTAAGSTPANAANAELTEGSSTVGTESMAGSSAASKPAGFMFGAPRMKERKKERRTDTRGVTKSHSSSSNISGNAPPTGSDTITDSKASGSVAAAPDSSGAAAPSGSSAECALTHSMHTTAPVSSYGPATSNKIGMFGAGAGGGSVGVVGSTPSSRTSSAITDHKTIGRRIKASAMKCSTDGSTGRTHIRPTGRVGRDGSTVDSGTDSAGGGSLATGGGGSGLMDEALPEVVLEEEMEGDVEVPEAEAPAGEEVEPDRDQSSEPSSSEHLSIMSPPEGSDVENVLQLICNIFQLPVALVAAYRSANIFIRSTALKLTDDDQWRYSLAQWSMLNVYDLRDVLLVPDATLDERFRENYCVRSVPRVRFFMASPLRSSTGELLGTLCMADFKERMLQPADLLVVNNLQTLVIRQLERDMALAEERIANEVATEKLQQEMMRALDHFDKCIMFVDTSKPGWEVLYTNLAWEHVTGIPREHVFGGQLPGAPNGVPRVHVMGRPLQDFFMALGGAALDWSSTAADVESRAEFTVNRVAVRQKPDKLVSLHMRLATSEANGELEGMLPKGLPAWVKARGNETHNYFVFVEEANPQTGPNSAVYEALAKHVEKVPGLELSHLLGKGGFGSVYYGTWNGMPVAVKMIDNRLTKTNTEGVSLEALMGQELSHPNIVKTIKYVMRSPHGASSMSGSNSRGVGSNARTVPLGLHSRNHEPSLLGGLGVGALGAPGSSGRGAPGPPGLGSPGGRMPGMGSYMTSAQPGLSCMTSAQMAAAIDLTSASAMQPPQKSHYHTHMPQHRTTGATGATNTTGTTSDATTVAGGGSQYSAAGMPAQVSHGANIRGLDSTPNTPHRGSRSGEETSSGQTAFGPASIAPSSASTAAGPPSHASFGGQPANLAFLPGRTGSSTGPSGNVLGASGSMGHSLAVGTSGTVPAVGLPPQLAPLAAPASAAAGSIIGPYPAGAPPPALSSLTPEQQKAAMTSRFSLAFSTITSGGDVLVPDKGRSPSSSSAGGHTVPAHMCSADSGEDIGEVWIIMEFCDRGSLQDGLDRGALKLRKPGGEVGETHLPMMVATACEVASALNYLHAKGIVHGDLTAWNVMLCTAPTEGEVQQDRSGRNFVAKVADFGLSRTLDVRSKIKTRTYGTISHMPPECLINGIISKATDVFAFGVLLWQMYTGLRPWAGMNHGQIIYNVGMKNVQLLFPPGTPPAIADLSSSCTRTDPSQRPGFVEIMNKLDGIRDSLGL